MYNISYFLICYLGDVGATEQTKTAFSETLSCVSTALSKEALLCRKGKETFSGVTGRSSSRPLGTRCLSPGLHCPVAKHDAAYVKAADTCRKSEVESGGIRLGYERSGPRVPRSGR